MTKVSVKKQAIKIAKELYYDISVIRKIEAANSDADIYKIMSAARKEC